MTLINGVILSLTFVTLDADINVTFTTADTDVWQSIYSNTISINQSSTSSFTRCSRNCHKNGSSLLFDIDAIYSL